MKMNKLLVALGMGMTMLAGGVHAKATADQGHGTIKFSGSIIDAPCSISSDSDGQEVELGQISNAALKAGQTSTPKEFSIILEQCDVSALADGVSTTFTGAGDKNSPDMLGITGNASGAGIVITDGSSTPIKLGVASAPQMLGNGHNTLVFSAYLKADGASVVPGNFSSTADFKLSYN